jgi:NADPH:quinone reductase-like Zn-dependent oxidoreductase
MNAITFKRYGTIDVLNYEPIETPILGENQVLIQVHYASVNPVDWKVRKGVARFLTGFLRPKKAFQIPGADVSGTILSVGATVENFNVNDAVFVILGGIPGGGYAEQIVVDATQIALIPKSLDFKKSCSCSAYWLDGFTRFFISEYSRKSTYFNQWCFWWRWCFCGANCESF